MKAQSRLRSEERHTGKRNYPPEALGIGYESFDVVVPSRPSGQAHQPVDQPKTPETIVVPELVSPARKVLRIYVWILLFLLLWCSGGLKWLISIYWLAARAWPNLYD